jgi:gamma-tubulin complex component 2
MQTCTFFATYTGWLSRELERADPDLSGTEKPPQMNKQQWDRFKETQAQRQADPATTAGGGLEKMFDSIQKYENNFSRHLQILLDALNHYAATETVVLLGLCARLSTANQGTQYSGLLADEDGGAQA